MKTLLLLLCILFAGCKSTKATTHEITPHEHIWVAIDGSYDDNWRHLQVCVICHAKRIVNGE